MQRVADIRKKFIALKRCGRPHAGTYELIGESFIADEPTIFGTVNLDYVDRELRWYRTMIPSIRAMKPPIPKIWQDIASPTGDINSNYGYLIFSEANGRQYEAVLQTLRDSPAGRRGTMIYTRPSMHTDWNRDGMQDFVCTNAVNYFIRDGYLYSVVQMRSNDVVFGYRNDYAWQNHVMGMLIYDLRRAGVDVTYGDIVWNAASLHVYERHWDLIT
ncbi:MAG: thymidylate synthase [Candidatus Moraniibacteriota bacterium]